MFVTTAHRIQRGFTIVELLVGMALGVIVVGGAGLMYLASVQNSSETLKASRLNQEISALMLVMTNDIRRAGYWGGTIGTNFDANPFSQSGATALVVLDDMASDTIQPPAGSGTCLTYAYDATYKTGNTAGVVDTGDLFGFRLNGTVVQMRETGVVDGTSCVGGTCDSCVNGTWVDVTDPDLIEVTNLTFDLAQSQCLNGAEPNLVDDDADGTVDNDDEANCYVTIPVVSSGNATVESREVQITVAARLANDNVVQATSTQSVLVRNDMLRLR